MKKMAMIGVIGVIGVMTISSAGTSAINATGLGTINEYNTPEEAMAACQEDLNNGLSLDSDNATYKHSDKLGECHVYKNNNNKFSYYYPLEMK